MDPEQGLVGGVQRVAQQQLDRRDMADDDDARTRMLGDDSIAGRSDPAGRVGDTFAVLALPATDPISPTWSVRPFARISGWTLVCRGENSAALNGDCKEIVMVQDQDGHYPGPWF